jgi:ABC-type multidrug transport system fused ATPase/permease subunit
VLQLGLHDLRSRIAIIPQEPILFLGTLRNNLDPLGQYNDAELWSTLDDVHLSEVAAALPGGLDAVVSCTLSHLQI